MTYRMDMNAPGAARSSSRCSSAAVCGWSLAGHGYVDVFFTISGGVIARQLMVESGPTMRSPSMR